MSDKNCPCCHNHCPKDHLNCGRGIAYFSQKDHEEPSSLHEQVMIDLRKCGHSLHHNKELTANELFSDFSEEELSQLHSLLSKIHHSIA